MRTTHIEAVEEQKEKKNRHHVTRIPFSLWLVELPNIFSIYLVETHFMMTLVTLLACVSDISTHA